MDDSLRIPTLEELTLIKISITLWSRQSLRDHTRKQTNGLVCMDEVINLMIKEIRDFELSSALKNNLIDVFERVGYELYLFMSESILNSSNLKYFTTDYFSHYTVNDLNLSSDIKWNQQGEILLCDTLDSYIKNHQTSSPFLVFMAACENCDEKNVFKIWNKLSPDQKSQIKKTRTWSKQFLFLNYWLCLLENCMDDFLIYYGNNILTFDDRRSLHYNLLKYSIMRCFRNNIAYFYSKLTDLEKADFFEVVEINGKKAVLLHILQMEAFCYMKYVNKFFEIPLMNHKINKFIIEKLSKYSFKDLVEYNIQQVGTFGDLQCNIFLYLMFIAPQEVKSLVTEKLDFYVLTLIGKGKLKTVNYLLNEETKKLLRTKITSDLKNCENLTRISKICMNNHCDLVEEFFDSIAENENDRFFLQSKLESIKKGTQYDDIRQ